MAGADEPVAAARFRPGEPVRVRMERPAVSAARQHIRTPHYVRGQTGTVTEVMGLFRNPEGLAAGEDGLPEQVLYRVLFPQTRLWPGYQGAAADTLEVELYEHWLEPGHG
jgi:nitrile hydratase